MHLQRIKFASNLSCEVSIALMNPKPERRRGPAFSGPTKLAVEEIDIIKRLRQIRQHRGQSQRAFAESLRIEPARLASIEALRAPLRFALGFLVCERTNSSLRWLATGLGPQEAWEAPVLEAHEHAQMERFLFSRGWQQLATRVSGSTPPAMLKLSSAALREGKVEIPVCYHPGDGRDRFPATVVLKRPSAPVRLGFATKTHTPISAIEALRECLVGVANFDAWLDALTTDSLAAVANAAWELTSK